MERPRFKKSLKKKKPRDPTFLMYFPYAETLMPFQPAGLKRKGSGVAYSQKSASGKQRQGQDSDSEEELEYVPTHIDLATKLRQILREEDTCMEHAEACNRSSSSQSASMRESESSVKKHNDSQPGTYSQFVMYSPTRGEKKVQGLRRSHATQPNVVIGEMPRPDDVWERCARHSASPFRGFSPPRTEAPSVCLQSPLRLPSVRKEAVVAAKDLNAQSFPTFVGIVRPAIQLPNPPAEQTISESESNVQLSEKPKTCKVRVRKHKQSRAAGRSPRPKTSAQVIERKAVATSCAIFEPKPRSGPPAVAEKTDNQHREFMLDVLLRNKTSQDHAMIMQEYVKRIGLPENTRIFILYSQDEYMRRSLRRRGWHENKVCTSSAFHLKWTYSDSDPDYHALRPGQFFNHFANNRKLTTKCGLSSCFRTNYDYQLTPDTFYPRTYDLGDSSQLEELRQDYERTAALSVIKQHAEYFLTLPQRAAGEEVSLINRVCLKVATKYCKQLLEDMEDKCEHISKYCFVPDRRRSFCSSKEDWKFLMEYCKVRLPVRDLTEEVRLRCGRKTDWSKVWILPQRRQMDKCISLYYRILSAWPQAIMEGSRNAWIVKPSQNARGSGVHCTDDLSEIIDCGAKLQARIVQKYIERPLLLTVTKGKVKFDIRQWVLVTAFDPLEIYVFNSCYLRLCTQPFTLEDLKDKFSHLANYSVQKAVSKSSSDTVWSLGQFLIYLSQHRPDVSWRSDVQPQLHSLILQTLKCVSEEIDPRPGCFELYGFDIILDETLKPWLLEVNLSPACAERTPWLTTMLDAMGDGLLSIVLDGCGEKPLIDTNGNISESMKIDTFDWLFLYKGESGPADNKDQPPCSLEIVGERVNLRKEKQVEKRFWKEQASVLIQKVVRGFLVRNRNKAERKRRAAVIIQKHVRSYLAKLELARLRLIHSVLTIQTVVRRCFTIENCDLLRKIKLAIKLQSIYRRWKAKETLNSLREVHTAAVIQRFWRTRIALFRLAGRKDCKRKVKKIQKAWKRRFRKVTFAAVRIQKRWRGLCGRRAADAKRRVLMCKLTIQTAARTFLARQSLLAARTYHSALILQCATRFFLSKLHLRSLLESKCATLIQRRYHSYIAHKSFIRFQEAKAVRHRAAIRIQSVLKGFRVREQYATLKRHRAATHIQRVFRGHICRVYFKIIKQRWAAAVMIQKRFRGSWARKKFEMMKRSKAQEKERARRKEQLRKEQLARGMAASERLAQRGSEIPAVRYSPVNEAAGKGGTLPVVSARPRPSSRSNEPKPHSRTHVTPPPSRQPPSTLEGFEILARPVRAKARIKASLYEARRGVR